MSTHVVTFPVLTAAIAPLVFPTATVDETGQSRELFVPAERSLTVYIDKKEIVTLMTLGQKPEWMVLGYLRNQGLFTDLSQIASVTVDWDVGSAAVKTVAGNFELPQASAPRVVTSGCGQGSMFGHLIDTVTAYKLPPTKVSKGQIFAVLAQVLHQQSLYKQAGSVHGCALFSLAGPDGVSLANPVLEMFIEDVGRHNALDTLSGWAWLQSHSAQARAYLVYTTGRLTSEMIMKAAQMGIAVVVSRSGMTQMGLSLAQQLNLCALGRARHQRYLCFSGAQRILPG
jgi:FdhD protein